jgi:hypothetical protein
VAVAIQPEVDKALEFLRSGGATRPLVDRILRGDPHAMLTVVERVAGDDATLGREWERVLKGLVEAIVDRSIDLGVLDFPMGTPFWDGFTIDECRAISGALASMGYRFDGIDGWQDKRTPTYWHLTKALADVGVAPRRVRAWPNHDEIAEIYRGAQAAPEEAVRRWAPTLKADHLRELLGARADALDEVWAAWHIVRPLLLEDRRPTADRGPAVP